MSVNFLELTEELTTEAPEDFNPQDIYNEIEEQQKEVNKAAKRRKRIKQCGSWIYYRNPHTGLIQTGIFECGNWRNNECPTCAEKRADQVKNNMVKYVSENKNNVGLIKADQESTNKVIRKIRDHARKQKLSTKDLYERFPGEKEDYLFVDPMTANKLGIKYDKITTVDILSMDWKKISLLSDGRNKSGSMSEPTNSDVDYVMIKVEEFSTDADPDFVKQLEVKVVEQTRHYNPKTPEDVEKYIQNRNNRLKAALKRAGHKITFRNKSTKKCQISRINWLKETDKFLEKYKNIPI